MYSPLFGSRNVGLSCRFRDTIFFGHCQDQVDGPFEAVFVADGNEHLTNIVPCSHSAFDRFTAMANGGGLSLCRPGDFVVTAQQLLTTADRRSVQQQVEVTGDAEPARMQKTLAIRENDVRLVCQTTKAGCRTGTSRNDSKPGIYGK